jgi:endonuclease III
LSLEWLRECCVEDVRHFFSGALGLGRKSVGCASLLTLRKRDFPVDVNVGRICARLGWIPLQVGRWTPRLVLDQSISLQSASQPYLQQHYQQQQQQQ